MPGVYQMSLDEILKECEYLVSINLKSIILFAIPDVKDSVGSECLCGESIISRTIRAIKEKFPQMFVVTDLCFCEYTDHGHCGILDPKTGSVDNDKTLEISAQQALVHARAGADMIAPSGMMDGIITTLRNALDENGFKNLPIMAYSTKFASGYYGPFRDVAESTPSFGDRRTYQMNPANRLEAIEESLEDEKEGADILMVKPALAFLDVIRDIRNASNLPLCVYNVSGEYAMLKHAGLAGLIDYERVMMETMVAFKRAGANIIISYHAKEVCELLRKQN
jgi:porphobilinogen synthase